MKIELIFEVLFEGRPFLQEYMFNMLLEKKKLYSIPVLL